MDMPTRCECGFWDRDRTHSKLGGGNCDYVRRKQRGKVRFTGDNIPEYAYPSSVAQLLNQKDERIAELEQQLAEARELLQATLGMGFYFVDEDSGETHRDVSKRVDSLLEALAGGNE